MSGGGGDDDDDDDEFPCVKRPRMMRCDCSGRGGGDDDRRSLPLSGCIYGYI